MPSSSLTRRRRWPIFLPTLLLLLVAAGWSAFWFIAADRAGTEIDRAIAREAAAGRRAECGDRRIGGYPFRIEVRCTPARITLDSRQGPLVFEAPGFVAVAQLPVPSHLVAEMRSPATLRGAAGGPTISLSFSAAQASVQGSPSTGVDSLSVELKTPVLERIAGDQVLVGLMANDIAVHTRRAPAGPPGTWDLVARLTGAQVPVIESPFAQAPSMVELQLSLIKAELLAPAPTPERLRAFAAAGGKLHLALLRAEQGEVLAEAKGDVSLDPQGFLVGDATVTVAGMQQFLAKASEAGLGWIWTLLPLGRADKLGERPASTYAVRAAGGAVSVGPLRFGVLPPLF